MRMLVASVLCLVVAFAWARPNDIIDFEFDHMEHEQEGQAGKAVEGEYSWVAPNGEEYNVKYVADHLGYRVLESDATPELRSDLPEEEDAPAPEEEEEEEDDDEEEEEEEEEDE